MASKVRLSLVVATSIFAASPIHAGYYSVEYSGGKVTTVGPNSIPWHRDYGVVSGGWYGGLGISRNEPVGGLEQPAGHGSVTCHGEIRAIFTWVPDDAYDAPPQSAILRKQGSANWAGDSGQCSNGVTSGSTGGVYDGASSGETNEIISEPGESFTIYCIPHSEAVVGNPPVSANLAAVAGAYFRTELIPLEIVIHGSVRVAGIENSIIGSGVSATVSAPGYQTDDHAWTISGETFQRVEYGTEEPGVEPGWTYRTYRRIIELSNEDLADEEPKWHYDGDGLEIVSCSVKLFKGSESIGAADLVADVIVWKPDCDMSGTHGEVLLDPNNNHPNAITTSTAESGSTGADFSLTMQVPSIFGVGSDYGQMGYAQTCDLDYYQYALPHSVNTIGFELDNTWLYSLAYPADSMAGESSPLAASDSPKWGLRPTSELVTVDGMFRMFGVYKPPMIPGSWNAEWVSRRLYKWGWVAHSEEDNNGVWTGPLGNVYALGQEDLRNNLLVWEHVHLNHE